MMSATSSAGSRAFGGASQKAFGVLRKLGIKNLKAGVGCGVGIGHGFGVGIALKPGVSQQFVHSLQERLSAAASQLQNHLPSVENETQEAMANLKTESEQEGIAEESLPGNDVEEVPKKSTGFVPSDGPSVVKTERTTLASSRGNGEVEDLRQQNEILRTLLRQQDLMEDLKSQNALILRALSEQFDLQVGGQEMDPGRNFKVTAARKNEKLHYFHSHSNISHRKCFDCRLSARRWR